MIRTFLISTAMIAGLSASAFADACQDDVAKIDTALSNQELDADKKAQVEDMRSQAVQLCGAGNLDEGLAVTAEVKALLAIE
jgi:hypothetical protein